MSSPAVKHAAWPKAGAARVAVPGETGKTAKAGDLPVTLSAVAGGAPQTADVQVLGQDAARRAGISGVLLSVAGSGPAGVHARVSVDYSAFAQAAGAGFGARLRLVQLPACVLTTPEKPECRVQTPLKGGNDVEHQTVTADGVAVTAPQAPTGQLRVQSATGGTVLAATTGSSGPTGDYAATPLSSASTWSTSLNSGSFTWSYDMPLTGMPGDLSPKIGLSYSSGAVDGRTSNSNNQASWAGDGFNLDPGFVERTYKPCADDGAPKTNGVSPGDLCWATDNAVIAFAGHSGELIPVSADEWRIKGDDNTKVVRVRDAGRGNGDNDGEYFKATTSDGTSYWFGFNRLTNWSSGKPETKSVYTVPVFGNNAGEPCYNSVGFGSSWCQQGWRWNLDMVVDAHGNDITYWYTPETNNYGRNLKASDRTPYVRGGRLDHIEYGQQQGDIYSATVKPMARVDFKTAERCLETNTALCDPANIDTNRQYWYDTPWDQNCKDGTDCTGVYAPAFFTRTRLTQVVASTLRADGTQQPVDTWDLGYGWGTADYDYQLLLTSIQHTGNAATPSIALPKTTLEYKQLVNRLDRTGDGRLPFIKQRLGTVHDEMGGQIDVNYSAAACNENSLPTPQTNTTRCFPQQYQPNNDMPVTTEWFNKYVVESVIGTDRTGGAPDAVTHYTYLGDAAWHFDDLDGITKEKLKTWSQWRGYGQVRVETGGTSGMSTQADHFFLRGMNDDRTDPVDKTKKRSVTVPDGEGTDLTDDQAWAGYEYRTEQFDKPGGKVLTKTVNTPWKKTTATRVRDWGTTTADLTGTEKVRTFTSLDKGAGVTWRETRTNSTFDDYGRVKQIENLFDAAVPEDDQCERVTYADNTTAWILTGVIRSETVAANCAATVDRVTKPDGTSAVLSDVRLRYDGLAYGEAPVKGNVTTTHMLKTRSATTATYLDNTATYDTYGRTLDSTELAYSTTLDAVTDAPIGRLALTNDTRTTSTVYSPATGRATKSVITSPPSKAGDSTTTRTVTTDFDLVRGRAVDVVDANTKSTYFLYDALGRTLKVWLPNRSKAGNDTPNYEYAYLAADDTHIAAVASKSLNNDGSQDTSYTLFDGFGRVRQTQAPGDNGGRMLADTFYDGRGQAVRTYAPHNASGVPSRDLLKNADTSVETQTAAEYDGLGRIVKSTVLSGNGVGTPLSTTLTEYGGDRVTVTPPQGATPTTTVTDAAGRTTELRQYKAATPTGAYDATRYAYDPAGHLTKLTDPAGTEWTWLYDQLGRQTKAVDPDSGTSTKTYNNRGEATTATDGRGKTVATVYDNLGRVLETRDGSATGPLLTSQLWDPTGFKGQLASTSRWSTVGGTAYEYKTAFTLYDALYRPGRTTTTVPSVPGQEALAGSYLSGTTYGLDGLPKSVSYPAAGNLAGESVSFTYDTLHRQTAATGSGSIAYLSGQTYDFVGKPLQSTLSNGTAGKQVYVTNGYEFGTQRLKSSRTDRYGIATPVRAAEYTYDQAGNVTSLTDTSSSGTDRQCYQYDYLARLTEAFTPTAGSCPAGPTGAALGGPAPYWTSWTYNTNGTRASETQHDAAGNTGQDATTTYGYNNAAQPHTLTGTSTVTGALGTPVPQSYGYDPAGNTTDRHLKPTANQSSDQKLTWDTEGHLAQVADTVKTTSGSTTTTTNKTTDYLYDATGNRLLAHNLDTAQPAAENWTLYLGGTELTLTKGATKAKGTRYYPLGAATGVRTDDNTLTFQINDHHGTAEIGINATTGAVDQRRTTPFGATRGTAPTNWAGTRGFLGGTNEPTGLTHLSARDYDPTTARFTSIDPLLAPTDPQSLNGYAYSDNNPLTFSDPSGLMLNCGGDRANCPTGGHSGGDAPGGSGDNTEGGGSPGPTPDVTVDDDGDVWIFNKTIRLPNQKELNAQFPTMWNNYGAQFKQWAERRCSPDNKTPFCESARYSRLIDDGRDARDPFGIMNGYDCFVNQTHCKDFAIDVALNVLGSAVGAAVKGAKGILAGAAAGTGEAAPASAGIRGVLGKILCKNSFPAETRVLRADGSAVPIEDLKVGDEVLATDPETGETGPRRIDAAILTPDDRDFTTLTVQQPNGSTEKITATDHHPFWSESRRVWVDAADLEPGDTLRTSQGATVRISATSHWQALLAAHNLTVEDLHTYYVLVGNVPVLVHNAGADIPPPIVANGILAYQNGELSQRVVRDRVTGRQVLDFYEGRNVAARVRNFWGGAKIYDIPGGGNDYRLLVKSDGTIGWVEPYGGVRGRGHNYDSIKTFRPPC
ncbi:polymorphic toxin-type HINT domain-containing protein [Kitasatospora sp. NPDC093679]|uniref:polymorphic toxin-type HINT domain-containing protein n=1 Tax=Kitasatospora sp. NPDC093679 TaxID=3154983 RepID=UPI003441002B